MVAAMVNFRPIRWGAGAHYIVGGHLTKPKLATTKTIKLQGDTGTVPTPTVFVKLSSKERWIAAAIIGKHGEWTTRSDLIETLRREVTEAWDNGSVANNPMLQSNILGRRNIMRSSSDGGSTAKNMVLRIPMPDKCPQEDADCLSFRVVRLYVVDRSQVWIHHEGVAWAVRYMFVQHQLKGVPSVQDDDVGPGGQLPCACGSLVPAAAGSSTVGGASRDWDSPP